MLRTIVAGMLIFTVTSCTSWNPVLIRPDTYITTRNPASIWVQLRDSSTLVLGRPRVFLDTLRGIDAGAYRNVPLSNVARLRAEEPAVVRTALLITAAAALTVGLIYAGVHSDRVQQ